MVSLWVAYGSTVVAAGSHLWDAGGVQVEPTHTEASSLLTSRSHRTLRLFGFDLMTTFSSLMLSLSLFPRTLSQKPRDGKDSWHEELLLVICSKMRHNLRTQLRHLHKDVAMQDK